LFWLGAGLSVFYLLLVALSILLQPLLSETSPLTLMQRSNLWLGPCRVSVSRRSASSSTRRPRRTAHLTSNFTGRDSAAYSGSCIAFA
jgi:hypothetical protein